MYTGASICMTQLTSGPEHKIECSPGLLTYSGVSVHFSLLCCLMKGESKRALQHILHLHIATVAGGVVGVVRQPPPVQLVPFVSDPHIRREQHAFSVTLE